MNQQKDIIRDARVLGTPKMLLLGLQHMFAMFGATILVPILVNSYFQSTSQVLSVQVTLFCAGFGTLFFHLCTKFKVPAFLGSSFAFLGGFSSVAALDTGIFANMADKEKLQYACGGIVVAGLLYLILALIIRCRIYTALKEKAKELAKKPNYLTVPAAIRELEKIEMTRQLDKVYRLDHAVTKTQKVILSAFGMDWNHVKYRAENISKILKGAFIG